MSRASESDPTRDADDRLIEAAKRQALDDNGSRSGPLTATIDSKSHRTAQRLVLEGYDIIGELHRGGQGAVYKAYQKSMKRDVAIKVLLGGAYASDSAKRRFEREIELIASLKHPNIVAVHDSGVTSDGQPYCVMDYVEGKPLDAHVRASQSTLEETLTLFGKICDAVTYAHQRGVIHRDLKPSNILIDADGSPKVLDFGLAKNLAGPVDRVLSVTGQVVGTLPYMSPEQAQGVTDEIDTRTDVYALGVILYELLTGHYPYPVVGKMAEILNNIVATPATVPSHQWTPESGVSRSKSKRFRSGRCPIDDEVQTIVLRCLSKERERRYQSAGGLLRDIERYLAGEPIEAKRDSTWYLLRKLAVRHTVASVALVCVLVTIISFGVISFELYRQTRNALDAKAASDALTLQRSRELEQAVDASAIPAVRRMTLGWFLSAWRTDRLGQANEIMEQTPAGSPERVGMSFLLDPAYSVERLLEDLPVEDASFGYFLAGERHLKAGRVEKAIAALEQSLSLSGDTWVTSAAQAALTEARARLAVKEAQEVEP